LGFGLLPIGLYFYDLIKPREIIPNDIHYRRLLDWVPDSSTMNLDSWRCCICDSGIDLERLWISCICIL
jgi:hypothetical protein